MPRPPTLVLSASPPPPRGSEGRRIYAVGDVHGRIDLLDALAAKMRADAQPYSSQTPPLWVFLGDYIDRGPSSPAVLDRLIAWGARDAPECVFLCGNHEHALVRFLADSAFGPHWMSWGGGATLAAYGVQPPSDGDPDAWRDARDAFSENLPDSHCDFLLDLPFSLEVGDYFFAHAGARPGVPLQDQEPADLMTIRDDFLDALNPFDRVVVHGHTPQEEPSHQGWRIGVDTGAYATGVLTAACILDYDVRFIHTGGGARVAVGVNQAPDRDGFGPSQGSIWLNAQGANGLRGQGDGEHATSAAPSIRVMTGGR